MRLPSQRVDLPNGLQLVTEPLQPQRALLFVGWKDLYDVPPDPEPAAGEVDVVALVLQLDQPA